MRRRLDWVGRTGSQRYHGTRVHRIGILQSYTLVDHPSEVQCLERATVCVLLETIQECGGCFKCRGGRRDCQFWASWYVATLSR